MSQYSGPYAPQTVESASEPSTTDVARDEAAGVGQHAREAGGQVAQTATDQARQVVAETGQQARDLLGEAQGQARDQASVQQKKAAQQLHTVADELGQMAANGGQSGVATEFARQAADRAHGAASWLEQREPADLLDEVRSFARRRPGTFLIGAAVAGLAAGRLTRGLKDRGNDQQDSGPDSGRGTAPGLPAANTVDPAGAPGPTYPTETYPTETYPAAPGYPAGTEPVEPIEPIEPSEPSAPPFPADPIYQSGSVTPPEGLYPPQPADLSEPVYPPEPGAAPRFDGPR
jgi:hypothetical protein